MLEIAVDLLPAPPPRMVFAHQGCGGVNGALIVWILSISIEALGQIRTVERHLTQGVGRQKRIVLAAGGYGAKQAPSRRQSLEMPHRERSERSLRLGVDDLARRNDEILGAGRRPPEFLSEQKLIGIEILEPTRFAIFEQRLMQRLVAAHIEDEVRLSLFARM